MRSRHLKNLRRFLARTIGIPIDYRCIRGHFNGPALYRRIAAELPDGGRIAEVGCFYGQSTCYMAQLLKRLGRHVSFDVIDTFAGSPEHQAELQGRDFYEAFLQNMRDAKVLTLIRPRKAHSEEAARAFPDDSFNFVYIDAAHDYESVKTDIDAWLPKVAVGGVLAGDDYHSSWPGVIDAVHEKLGASNIEIVEKGQWLYRKRH
jgi:predicted O-methyltransferase YrrM